MSDGENETDPSSDSSSLSSNSAPRSSNPSFIPSNPKILDEGRFDCFPEDPLKIVKKIIKDGEGVCPQVGSKVSVHYVGTLLNGSKFDSSRDRNEAFTFKLGVGQVIKGWDYGVSSMKVGEVSDFEIQPDYAYGDNGSPPSIPPNSALRFNIELLSFEKEPVTATEKLAFGAARKDEGNAFVKQQRWLDALHCYDRGLAYVQYLYSKNEAQMAKRKELHEQLQSNKALCCIKLDKVGEGILACDEILRVDQTHAKAWYRRALLLVKQGNYLGAKSDLQHALEHSPSDSAVRAELDRVNAHLKDVEQKEKKKFSNMFEKLKALEEQEAAEKTRREAEDAARTQRDREKEALRMKRAIEKRKGGERKKEDREKETRGGGGKGKEKEKEKKKREMEKEKEEEEGNGKGIEKENENENINEMEENKKEK